MADKILEVKNLKVSFRTSSGTLKAVRDISFDLYRGRTLAIVGESGSGKSVTSKAILGILAGNSIIEGGEILYDGMDLLKMDEETMHTIRGDKISMIFQDPLSSLNPIVKIGPQITEAMLLKNKSGRKNARREFNTLLETLKNNMKEARPSEAAHIDEMVKTFDNFCIEANKLEDSYNRSDSNAQNLKEDITNFLYMHSKKQKQSVKQLVSEQINDLKNIKDAFYVHGFEEELAECLSEFNTARSAYRPDKNDPSFVNEELISVMEKTSLLMDRITEQIKPNFFRIGYYKMVNPEEDIYGYDRNELNEKALKILDEGFMNEFLAYSEDGLRNSFDKALAGKKEAIAALAEAVSFYSGEIEEKSAEDYAKALIEKVESGIDYMQTNKDSYAYTFRSSLNGAVEKYFFYKKNNPKEEERFAKQSAKREQLIARGKNVDWKVVPKNVLDLDELKSGIVKVCTDVKSRYEEQVSYDEPDFSSRAVEMVDFFREKASTVVYVITKDMAKQTAIKLMTEVGIPEPRMRYDQYPFEFSGGMRQRIVIAIALAANPEILICDEPTTALDVTIQAQLLELINKLKEERNLSIIFITHDLGVVAQMADEIAVMYAGKIVEQGLSEEVFYDPRHPYTWALLSSMPDLDTKEKLEAIPGTPPNMIYPPEGDAFADRNKYAMEIDFEKQPPMFEITETHKAATWLLHPDAPKVEMPKIITERIERMKAKLTEGQDGK